MSTRPGGRLGDLIGWRVDPTGGDLPTVVPSGPLWAATARAEGYASWKNNVPLHKSERPGREGSVRGVAVVSEAGRRRQRQQVASIAEEGAPKRWRGVRGAVEASEEPRWRPRSAWVGVRTGVQGGDWALWVVGCASTRCDALWVGPRGRWGAPQESESKVLLRIPWRRVLESSTAVQ